MKKFIKENWFKLTIIFIIVIITSGLFYWYEYRPSEIKKECFRGAVDFTHEAFEKEDSKGSLEEFKKAYDLFYINCLRKNGL